MHIERPSARQKKYREHRRGEGRHRREREARNSGVSIWMQGNVKSIACTHRHHRRACEIESPMAHVHAHHAHIRGLTVQDLLYTRWRIHHPVNSPVSVCVRKAKGRVDARELFCMAGNLILGLIAAMMLARKDGARNLGGFGPGLFLYRS